jgi:hypothetical protein
MTDQTTPTTPEAPRRELPPALQALSQAIRNHGTPPQVVMCGFDLWLEIMGSGHTSMRDFLPGGIPAKGDETDGPLKVPIVVLGGRIVVSLDPTLPPDHFQLKP